MKDFKTFFDELIDQEIGKGDFCYFWKPAIYSQDFCRPKVSRLSLQDFCTKVRLALKFIVTSLFQTHSALRVEEETWT